MNKFWIKTLRTFYLFTGSALYLSAPILIGILVFDIIKPEGYLLGIISVITWIIMCWVIVLILIFLAKWLRERNSIINKQLEIIEDIFNL